jgi:transcriptional regulator with XRE-family HTH domain/tetratricopeptide (TPR) repeat protein
LDQLNSFGYWVRRQRKLLDMTQSDLAQKVSCSLSMIRKIEHDERRPSEQLANLLAENLAIDDSQQQLFLQMARGQFTTALPTPIETGSVLTETPAAFGIRQAERATFVARKQELKLLHAHLEMALDDQGRMIFITGEAGRGKTSLLYEFAQQALAARIDLIVAGGSSDIYTGLGDPLLPFRDIFRLLAGDLENAGMSGIISPELVNRLSISFPTTVQILMENGPHLIDTIVSGSALKSRLARTLTDLKVRAELLTRLNNLQNQRSLSSVQELQQDRLFEEISTTLIALSRYQPLLFILDDLHWIDHSSAGLIGHLVLRIQQCPIMLIGSFRPEDLVQGHLTEDGGQQPLHPLSEVLSESQRQFGENRIDLDHPDPDEELEFVNALVDAEDNDIGHDFRVQLAQLTEGHPLFVVELLRDMKERGDIELDSNKRWKEAHSMNWEHLPARVEGVIEKRISRLSPGLRDFLTIGSVQGETFFAEVIARVKQIDSHELTRMLSRELDRHHRLIQEEGIKRTVSERLSQFRFRHHLFQKYLYARLSKAERMYLHEDVGKALEALFVAPNGNDDIPATQLARHFQEAQLGLKASKYHLIAGQKAAKVIAFDEAAAYFERGLDSLEKLPASKERNHLEYDLWLALAQARWHGGFIVEAMFAFEKSIDKARNLDDPEALAQAVLAYEEPRWRLRLDPEPSKQYMLEALSALGEKESPLQVRLQVNLTGVLLTTGEQEGMEARVKQLLQLARRINDPITLCDALQISIHTDRRPEKTEERLETVEEFISLAEAIGDRERLADALDLFIYDHLELGNIELVDETIDAHKNISNEIRQPFQLHIAAVFQAMRAIMRGEFSEAERLADEAAEISQRIGLAGLDGIYGIQMFTIRAEQGRLEEIAPIVKLFVDINPGSATWRPGLALIYASLGDHESCREVFDALAVDGFARLPHDSMWATSLAYLTEACAFLGDEKQASILFDFLLPYSDRTIVVGGATACYGAAARYLGMLATTMSNWPAAEQHFEAAIEMDTRLKAWPWLAHSQYEYSTMLFAKGVASDRARAFSLLDLAVSAAKKMNMNYLLQKITTFQKRYDNS